MLGCARVCTKILSRVLIAINCVYTTRLTTTTWRALDQSEWKYYPRYLWMQDKQILSQKQVMELPKRGSSGKLKVRLWRKWKNLWNAFFNMLTMLLLSFYMYGLFPKFNLQIDILLSLVYSHGFCLLHPISSSAQSAQSALNKVNKH